MWKHWRCFSTGNAHVVEDGHFPNKLTGLHYLPQLFRKKKMNQTLAPNFAGALPTADAEKQTMRGSLTVYGCGGTGVNIVRPLEALRNSGENGTADIIPFYLDTSVSNFQKVDGLAIPASACVKYDLPAGAEDEDIDGSGGVRATNHGLIREATPYNVRDILPSYAAAIVCSGGGGSGSLIAPYLLKEVFKKSDIVFVFVVGDRSTDTRAKNTVNTIQSMEGIARSADKTVVISYHENTLECPRSKVNEQILRSLTLLSLLVSRQNGELDTMDLRNFVQHQNVSGDEAHVAKLDIVTGIVSEENISPTVSSIATLTMDADDSGLRVVVPHACMGVLPPSIDQSFASMNHIHFLIDPMGIDPIISNLSAARTSRIRETARPVRRVDLLSDANVGDDGIVV